MGLHILVVDDDLISRKLITIMLNKYKDIIDDVSEANNGFDALEIFKKDKSIDMVILDIRMPVLDGYDFVKRFRSDSHYNDIPIIIQTADGTRKSSILGAGADAFLLKPILEYTLISAVKELLIQTRVA